MGSNLMRTVTFADPRLLARIQSSFVAVWHNQDPFRRDPDAPQTQPRPSDLAAYPAGGGGTNLQTYACDPEGRIVHYLEGFWRPPVVNRELDFALKQLPRPEAERAEQLAARLESLAREQEALRREHPDEFTKPVRLSAVRKQHAGLGLLQASYQKTQRLAQGTRVERELAEAVSRNANIGVIS